MSARTAGRIAWSLWVVSVALILGGSWLGLHYPPPVDPENLDAFGDLLWMLSWVGFGLVGAIILSRHPGNRVGWTLCGITSGMGINVMSTVYARADYVSGSTLPLGKAAAWIGSWVYVPAFGLVLFLVLLFPTGRLLTWRRRWLARLTVGLIALESALFAVQPGPIEGDGPPLNPLGLTALEGPIGAATATVGGVLVIVALLIVADAVDRWRRSTGVERQQFRWFALAIVLFPLLFTLGVALEGVIDRDGFDPVVLVFLLGGNGIAAAIGIAVTRYGLYEINRVISRTVSYVVLTVVLVALYLAAVTVLTAITAPLTNESPLAVAAATLLAAGAFGPARRRIQAVVDRRFNRTRYDAARTVDAYRARLRDEVDLEAVARDLLATATGNMQPAGAALWLATGPQAEKFSKSAGAVTVPERGRETRGVL